MNYTDDDTDNNADNYGEIVLDDRSQIGRGSFGNVYKIQILKAGVQKTVGFEHW